MSSHVLQSVTFSPDDQQFTLSRADGSPLLTQRAQFGKRPYIHPLIAPDGYGVLTEDSPPHHPWQHGLYTGLNAVNGVGFWTETSSDGVFCPEPLCMPICNANSAHWHVDTKWQAPQGMQLLQESQEWTLVDNGGSYHLDLKWTLIALTDLTFGQHAYGGLFLRMPYRAERGGTAINSGGQAGAEAESERARWVAVSMPIEGREAAVRGEWAGIVLMDHVHNSGFPVPWRVDGELGIGPSRCIAGSWQLAAQSSVTFRHRAFVFSGQLQPDSIELLWKDFQEEAG